MNPWPLPIPLPMDRAPWLLRRWSFWKGMTLKAHEKPFSDLSPLTPIRSGYPRFKGLSICWPDMRNCPEIRSPGRGPFRNTPGRRLRLRRGLRAAGFMSLLVNGALIAGTWTAFAQGLDALGILVTEPGGHARGQPAGRWPTVRQRVEVHARHRARGRRAARYLKGAPEVLLERSALPEAERRSGCAEKGGRRRAAIGCSRWRRGDGRREEISSGWVS